MPCPEHQYAADCLRAGVRSTGLTASIEVKGLSRRVTNLGGRQGDHVAALREYLSVRGVLPAGAAG